MTNKIQDCRDTRFLALRAEIFERDGHTCVGCGDSEFELFLHFKTYDPDKEPWEYPKETLVSLCETCLAEERQLLGDATNLLALSARQHFLSDQIDNIACALGTMELPATPDLVAEAISLWLRMPALVKMMLNTYQRKLSYEATRRSGNAEESK